MVLKGVVFKSTKTAPLKTVPFENRNFLKTALFENHTFLKTVVFKTHLSENQFSKLRLFKNRSFQKLRLFKNRTFQNRAFLKTALFKNRTFSKTAVFETKDHLPIKLTPIFVYTFSIADFEIRTTTQPIEWNSCPVLFLVNIWLILLNVIRLA